MATACSELISDETLPVVTKRHDVARGISIAATRFGPVDDLTFDLSTEAADVELNDRAAFRLNYIRWLDESIFDSLPAMMRSHESYQSIVGRGERVLPFIAAELRRRPSFIFLALEDITGADPVPEEALGNLQATTDAWLSWLQS